MNAVRALVVATALVLCLSITAQAEVSRHGDLVVSFESGVSPRTLPRHDPAPVAVSVSGKIRGSGTRGTVLPQLRTISIAVNRGGLFDVKGLPTCVVNLIQPATEAEAHKVCGDAIVGSGHVALQVHLPAQRPFSVQATLLAFNAPARHGHNLMLAQVYSKHPLGAFILPFTFRSAGGAFGTVMSTALPRSAREWAYLTHFDMTLQRTYEFNGRRRSYVSAACAAPAGFGGAVFPFAKASYGFDNGQTVTTTVVRSCHVSN
jgi:hypothetical protein